MNIEEAVKLIRGQRGTKVKLEILRGSKSFFKILSREKIEIKSVSSKVYQTKNGLLIGYVRIKQFNANASKETRDAIKDLEPLRISSLTLVPLCPLINFTASSIFMPSVEISSIDNILSLALIPASNAGVPSIGEIIIKSSDS